MKKTSSSFAVCLPALIISLLKGGDDLGALFATEEGMARQEGEEGDQKKDEPAKKRKRQKKKIPSEMEVAPRYNCLHC